MAIRLRVVEGMMVALCAARSVPKPGDLYLDDGEHYAIAEKFWRDYPELNLRVDPLILRLVEQEESNNPNREWWDRTYVGQGEDNG